LLLVASDDAFKALLRAQLDGVQSWKMFLATPLVLEPESIVSASDRRRLDALPSMIRVRGDAVPLEYEVEGSQAAVRLRLREGQARRLSMEELPALDRPIRFAVARGGESPLRADTLEELRDLLKRAITSARAQRRRPPPRRGGRRR
jgi:hypothetical protein